MIHLSVDLIIRLCGDQKLYWFKSRGHYFIRNSTRRPLFLASSYSEDGAHRVIVVVSITILTWLASMFGRGFLVAPALRLPMLFSSRRVGTFRVVIIFSHAKLCADDVEVLPSFGWLSLLLLGYRWRCCCRWEWSGKMLVLGYLGSIANIGRIVAASKIRGAIQRSRDHFPTLPDRRVTRGADPRQFSLLFNSSNLLKHFLHVVVVLKSDREPHRFPIEDDLDAGLAYAARCVQSLENFGYEVFDSEFL